MRRIMNRTRNKQITRIALTIRLIVFLGCVIVPFAMGARWPWYTYLGIGIMALVTVRYIQLGELPHNMSRSRRRPQNY